MTNAQKVTISFCIAVLVVVLAVLFFFRTTFSAALTSLESFSSQSSLAENIPKELFSAPLEVLTGESGGMLTDSGVIALTNTNREENGDKSLAENAELDAAAKAKLDDMFKQQYFAHVSPQGNGPGYVVNNAGYVYLVVGENLALGNFADDTALVNAWMASPGHRANILNKDFVDIGVAVGEGNYQGREVWIAVQEFGRPASACPTVDVSLKARIQTDQDNLSQMNTDLATDRQDLSTMPQDTPDEQSAYNEKVQEYNSLVATYNTAQDSLQAEINTYNDEVKAFNTCLAE